MNKNPKTTRSIIAAAKDDTQFKAVELRVHDDEVEILWAKSVSNDERTWSHFAVECGLAQAADARGRFPHKDATTVVGLDSTAVAFYKITTPTVNEEETAAIVRMQVESLLPLPPEQIEVAWRTTPSTDGKMDVTIAAARCDHLERFMDGIRDLRPQQILLSCEGTTQAWQSLFMEHERQATVLSIGQRHTQVCLVEAGHVVHAGVLDVGMSALTSPGEQGDAAERFSLDLRILLDSFGWEVSSLGPVFVLSDGSDKFDQVAAALNAGGLFARTSVPSRYGLKGPAQLQPSDIYEYRTPLGLALLAMREPADRLDLFRDMLRDQTETAARRARYSVLAAAVVALFMAIALIVTSYVVDRSRDRHYRNLLSQTDLEQARQRQSLLKTIAQNRPDLLQLLADVNAGQNAGIVLDSLHFKKGQAVTVIGQADNEEQLWAFQKNLGDRKAIQDVEPSNVSRDSKTKKIRFTLTFQYKGYTKKDAVL
ncbi:MAG: hypothetical protein JW955_07815 [Sedimentisphaerales bacterium]|nr:hypothetical protein [Sedimentisphaerales bacterium]